MFFAWLIGARLGECRGAEKSEKAYAFGHTGGYNSDSAIVVHP